VAAATTLTERCGALLRLTTDDGVTGWGDCAPLPSGGDVAAVLDSLAAYCCHPASADFSRLPAEVRWAIETAQFDIAAQQHGLPIARWLAPTAPGSIAVNAALGALDADCSTRARVAIAQGFRIGKIKVGIDAIDTELARLIALVEATDGRLQLRLDANRAWCAADAQRFLTTIIPLPIDAIEEPLATPTLSALRTLQAALPYALAVDESLPQFGAEALIAAGAVRRLVLKPARLGGFTPTLAVARAAQAAGMEVVITSVVDSAIGVTAAAHLAAALAPTLTHGLGTSAWLGADVAPPPRIDQGRLQLPAKTGLGIQPR
jgi:o-succinylbenzoate synthase